MIKLVGVVENIVFRNVENGYTVLDLDSKGELITAVGSFSFITCGEAVELFGEYKTNLQYGKQFIVSSYNSKRPEKLSDIVKYLSSGIIKGVGEVLANRIVEEFKKDTFAVIEYNPAELSKISGISKKKAMEIGEMFNDVKVMQDSIIFLLNYDISMNTGLRIYDVYKSNTIEVLKTNPYKLVEDVDGIGFLTADKIAFNLGIPKNSEFRMRAGILHCLKMSAERAGNTFLPKKNLKDEVFELLSGYYDEVFENTIKMLQIENVVKVFEYEDFIAVELNYMYYAELSSATSLAKLAFEKGKLKATDEEIAHFEKANKIQFHSDQKNAIKMAIEEGASVITGGPGTGKTTIIKGIISILENNKLKYMLLAPTGRAAKRLNESTQREAKTIHRGLEVDKSAGRGKPKFKFNEQNKLPCDVIIVDEVSMIDVMLFNSLLKAIKTDAKLILVGDKNQLPSVGAGNVLADIITSGEVACCHLTQIYRQDETSKIVENAYEINLGNVPELTNNSSDFFFEEKQTQNEMADCILGLVATRLPKFLKARPQDIQVLCPMKNGASGIDELNRRLQNSLNPKKFREPEIVFERCTFRARDKVMQIKNNYDMEWTKADEFGDNFGTGVFNGDMGIIKYISPEMDFLLVGFDDGREARYERDDLLELTLAYAITIHKSQGSEFDYVVIPVIAGSPQILTKNLLYTAITRAKKLVVLVGTKKNIAIMCKNNYVAKRFSSLNKFLKEKAVEVRNMYGDDNGK